VPPSAASPRDRRLKSDFEAMLRLQEESSIVRFRSRGTPADQYIVTFHGAGTCRREESQEVLIRHEHTIWINLTAAYPRMIPELSWRTPIFHPNVSASGVVCLGAYQTNWVPSLKLDELCLMLWDMIRYRNYDSESPYNREAAMWARDHKHRFPLDQRPLRDRHMQSRQSEEGELPQSARPQTTGPQTTGPQTTGPQSTPTSPSPGQAKLHAEASAVPTSEMLFLDSELNSEVVEAELLDDQASDILFIE
jgi:ubiquitin-protein ligase